MNITTVLPVHEYDEKIESLLDKALESATKQDGIEGTIPFVLVYASLIKDKITKYVKKYDDSNLKIKLIENTGDTGFQSQINLGVKNVETDYFSILEFDDELAQTYYKRGEEYIKSLPDIDVFLQMIVETNESEQALKFTNETVWSRSFVGENGVQGYLNANSLNQYTDFKICGAIIKKSEFESVGMLKKNIVLTFQYEFLLRLINNGGKVYTIPKIGYKHVVTREGSLFKKYEKEIGLEERKFWFETAKKESNFFTDREIDKSLMTVSA